MTAIKLYGFGESGNAYKVALMLTLSGCEWELIPVDFFNGETRTGSYRETVNEMGEVPVLVHGDVTLTQSGVILDYLVELTGKFGGETPAERREILRWMFYDNHKFTSYYATLRFLYGLMNSGETPVTEWLRGRVKAALDIVNKHMATRDFVATDRPTIADLSMVGYLYHPEPTGLNLEDWPHLMAWTRRIAALPGWKGPYELMPPARKKA